MISGMRPIVWHPHLQPASTHCSCSLELLTTLSPLLTPGHTSCLLSDSSLSFLCPWVPPLSVPTLPLSPPVSFPILYLNVSLPASPHPPSVSLSHLHLCLAFSRPSFLGWEPQFSPKAGEPCQGPLRLLSQALHFLLSVCLPRCASLSASQPLTVFPHYCVFTHSVFFHIIDKRNTPY